MKQILVLAFVLMMVISIAACGSSSIQQEQKSATLGESTQPETKTNATEKVYPPNINAEKQEKMQTDSATINILKISVFKSGEIQADGVVVNLATLEQLIANNASDNGMVWYYREAGQEEPSPQAVKVLDLIAKYRRPVSLSSKPDFSDYINREGKSVPRPK